LAEWQTQAIFPAPRWNGRVGPWLELRVPMLLVCKPIGRSGEFVFCSALHMKAPRTKDQRPKSICSGWDGGGAAFTRLCLITRAKAGTMRQPAAALGEQGQQGQQESRDRRAKSSQRRSRVYEARLHGVPGLSTLTTPHHSPGPPPFRPRVIINNSAYDSYPTARIARMACMACMASAADPDPLGLVRAWARQAPAWRENPSTVSLCR
jgi:hypothetical protein